MKRPPDGGGGSEINMVVRCGFAMVMILCIANTLFAAEERYAARVVGRKRYATNDERLNPNKPADAARASANTVVEEDLLNKGAKPRKLPESPISPPPAADPRESPLPPPPPSGKDMSPARRYFSQPYKEPPAEEGESHAGNIDERGGVGVALGIGFGYRSFSGQLGLTFPIYRWLAWGLKGSYYTWADDVDKETRYGSDAYLMVKIPSRIPLTPFAGAGGGYVNWRRVQKDIEFDDRGSLISLYFVGVSIPMAKHIALDISQTWKTYLGKPPRKFEDHAAYESYGISQFDVGLAIVF